MATGSTDVVMVLIIAVLTGVSLSLFVEYPTCPGDHNFHINVFYLKRSIILRSVSLFTLTLPNNVSSSF